MDLLKQVEEFELIPDRFFDKIASMPTFFTLIVIFQGCFGGMGVVQTPKRLVEAVDHPVMRALYVAAIAYTATSDIETAVFCTAVFFVFLYFMRTEEERKQVPTLL